MKTKGPVIYRAVSNLTPSGYPVCRELPLPLEQEFRDLDSAVAFLKVNGGGSVLASNQDGILREVMPGE